MRRYGLLAVLIILGLAFLGGYWPQHNRLVQAQNENAELKQQLSKAKSTISLCQLQSQLVSLVRETASKNFADAAGLSTRFFDSLRQAADHTPASNLKSSLEAALNQRDAVTAALARGDPKSHDMLVQMLDDLSQSLAPKESPPKN